MKEIAMKARLAGAAVAMALLATGCSVKKTDAAAPDHAKSFVIGMGDIMLQNQLHHTKLWFAGTAENWPLAKYELGELHGGFDRVATFHPKFKRRPTGPLVDEYVSGPFGELDKAVQDQNETEFTAGYNDLTNGCNACHKELGYPFNVIKRPTAPPFTDQDFEPARPS
jgi:hypothetical protein